MSPTSYIGSIGLFAGGENLIPKGWTLCDGKLLSITEFSLLYSIIGTSYGGDGIVNFAVPDLRGVIPIGETSKAPALGNVNVRYFSDNTTQELGQLFMTFNYCIAFEGTIPSQQGT